MLKQLLKILLASIIAVAAIQTSAFAENTERLEVINDTGQIIESLYITPNGNADWGRDFAAEYPFEAFQKKILKYNPAIRYFKVKMTLEDGREIVWADGSKIDFSRAWRMIIYSGKNDIIKYALYKLPENKSKNK